VKKPDFDPSCVDVPAPGKTPSIATDGGGAEAESMPHDDRDTFRTGDTRRRHHSR